MEQNKRRHRRVPIAASATVSFQERGEVLFTAAMVSNISLSGIGIYADNPLAKGQDVTIQVNFIAEDGIMKKDLIRGTVIHTNTIEALYYAGIEFERELSAAEQSDLYQLIQKICRLDSSLASSLVS